jgi:mono/diheme cytochrome c family protein
MVKGAKRIMRSKLPSCVLVLLLVSLGCMGGEQTVPATKSAVSTPAPTIATTSAPKELFEIKCSMCHSLDRPASKRKSYDEWLSTVTRMRGNGAPVTDEEAVVIAEYLAATYGKE